MKVFEDILYKNDEHEIIGFIDSRGDLEYSIFECRDGGFIYLQNREYAKEEITNLLEVELKNFINSNKTTITIIGHNIRIITADGFFLKSSDLDEEIYEINQSILDGNDCGDIFVESKRLICSWNIVK